MIIAKYYMKATMPMAYKFRGMYVCMSGATSVAISILSEVIQWNRACVQRRITRKIQLN